MVGLDSRIYKIQQEEENLSHGLFWENSVSTGGSFVGDGILGFNPQNMGFSGTTLSGFGTGTFKLINTYKSQKHCIAQN
jgi:hypothetical protein